MSGFVGARKARRPVGNQRWKLNMTTAAMSVLPIPVGIETRVLWQSAVLQIDCWYARTDMFVGYHHSDSAAWSAGTGGGRLAATASGSGHGARGAVFASTPVWLGARLSAGCGCHKGARGGGTGCCCVRPERTMLNAEFWGSASSGGRGGAGPGCCCPLK
eukprot:scaffold14758_cov54-Phaeocystis_antarctica.AAC.1